LAPESITSDLTEINPIATNDEEPALLVFVTDRSTLQEQRAQIVATAASESSDLGGVPESRSAWN